MTEILFASIVGSLISIVFRFFPGLASAYDALADSVKRLIMIGVLLAVSGIMFAMNCAGLLTVFVPEASLTCDLDGGIAFLAIVIPMMIANQSIYSLIRRT